jgi:alpha-D-ribose 1-methylphosphonate 5-triphosphate synthase subunit PhnI
VLYHSDNIEATGFVEHLKLPHYVDFQSELENLRTIRRSAVVAAEAARGGVAEAARDRAPDAVPADSAAAAE